MRHRRCCRRFWVDPRVRGGDEIEALQAFHAEGRSPRARGRLPKRERVPDLIGSIPACAGETGSMDQSRKPIKVDPRVRGGDDKAILEAENASGRSPRARGRLDFFRVKR